MKRYLPACSLSAGITLLLTSFLLLSGCSSVKTIETWGNPLSSGQPYQKLMIVGMATNVNLRESVENTLVKEFRNSGILAIASHTLVKDFENAKRDDFVAAVNKAGTDAVITIRSISKGNPKITQGGQSGGGIYGTGNQRPGGRSFSLATLQVNLYNSATEELVWTATISTDDAGNPARVSRDLAVFLLKNLQSGGFL